MPDSESIEGCLSELTASQIATKLKRDELPATDLQGLLRAIYGRRSHLQARLQTIEGAARRSAIESADAAQAAALNRESEQLDDELGSLAFLEARAFQLHAAASEREMIEAGQRGFKRIEKVIANAEAALTAYANARLQLQEVTTAIGGFNDTEQLKHATFGASVQISRLTLDEPTLDRVLDAMYPPLLVREEQRRDARSGLRRQLIGPEAPRYSEPRPDYVEQMHNIFQRRDS